MHDIYIYTTNGNYFTYHGKVINLLKMIGDHKDYIFFIGKDGTGQYIFKKHIVSMNDRPACED